MDEWKFYSLLGKRVSSMNNDDKSSITISLPVGVVHLTVLLQHWTRTPGNGIYSACDRCCKKKLCHLYNGKEETRWQEKDILRSSFEAREWSGPVTALNTWHDCPWFWAVLKVVTACRRILAQFGASYRIRLFVLLNVWHNKQIPNWCTDFSVWMPAALNLLKFSLMRFKQ